MADEDVEDCVIKELDVTLNRDIDGSLMLFQHILKSAPLKGAKYRAKREHNLFEIDVAGKRSDYDGKYGERQDKQTFRSVALQPSTAYVVGLVRPGTSELHLASLDKVVQFRPAFQYLDQSTDMAVKQNLTEREDMAASSQSESEMADEGTVRAVTMRFAGADEERIKKARESSFAHLQQQQALEEWSDMHYYSQNTEQSVQAKASLACRHTGRARRVVPVEAGSSSPSKEHSNSRRRQNETLLDDERMLITNVDDFLRVLS